MDSGNFIFTASMRGRAKGIPTNAVAQSPLSLTGFTMSLASTLTGASEYSKSLGPEVRTLAPSASEELDTQAYTNTLGQTAQVIAEVRLLFILHLSTSLATAGIKVGNATANKFLFFGAAATTEFTLLPGEGFILFAPTAAAIPADGTKRYLKVLNLDATALHTASYRVGWFGS